MTILWKVKGQIFAEKKRYLQKNWDLRRYVNGLTSPGKRKIAGVVFSVG